MAVSKTRLFVGNLPSKVSESAIKKKLGRFGNVLAVEMKQRTDTHGEVLSSFAFVDIETDSTNLNTCFQYFDHELWNNERVKVQLAKESFMERLKRERNLSKKSTGSILHATDESEIRDCELSSRGDCCDVSINDEIPHESNGKNWRRHTSCSPFAAKKSEPEYPQDFNHGIGDGNKFDEDDSYSNIPFKVRGLPMFSGTKMFADLEDSFKVDDTISGKSCASSHKLAKHSINIHKDSKRNLKETTSVETDGKKIRHQIMTAETEVNDSKLGCDFVERKGAKKKKENARENASKIPSGDEDFSSQADAEVPVERPTACGDLKIEKSRKKKSISDSGEESTLRNDYSSENYDWSVNSFKSKGNGNFCSSESQLMETQDTTGKEKSPKSVKKIRNSNAEEKPSRLTGGKEADKSKNDLMAEQKRLSALQERKKTFALQKDAVKKALSSIDSKTSVNKKIIFDYDDSDEEITHKENENIRSKSVENSKPKLFDDSSGDEELNETVEFKIKPQFEGPRGQKLLAIQSRYANDSRFNLDERFLESDDDGKKSGEEDETQEGHSADDLDAEKNRQLSILQDMLGVDVSTRKPKLDKPDKKRNSLQMVRFDPTNPEHNRYLVTEEELQKKKSEREVAKKRKKAEAESEDMSKRIKIEEEPIPVVTERFYKVSDKLKESLKKRSGKSVASTEEDQSPEENSGGFSLLKKFGTAPADEDKEEDEYSTKDIAWKPKEWDKNPFKYDSSDDEEVPEALENGDDGEAKADSKPTVEGLPILKSACERFYFLKDDPRFLEGLEFFTVKKTFTEMQEGFHEKRVALKSIIKAKVRNNKRRKRPVWKKLGGARKYKKRMGKR